MLASAIIVFREALEAALIIGIVAAAASGVVGCRRALAAGIVLGVAGAILVAVFAQSIASAARGIGQELLNAGVLLGAVLMLGWHAVWMRRHGPVLARRMNAIGRDVGTGAKPLTALAVVAALAVLREGSEVVLFLYGLSAAAANGTSSENLGLFTGGMAGLGAGVVAGLLLYFGLLRLSTRHVFAVTGWLIVLVAAGMASQAAMYLAQAGVLPSLGNQIWDSSMLLSERSLLGQLLHTLIGYDDRPSGLQLVFQVATFGTLAALTAAVGRPTVRSAPPMRH